MAIHEISAQFTIFGAKYNPFDEPEKLLKRGLKRGIDFVPPVFPWKSLKRLQNKH